MPEGTSQSVGRHSGKRHNCRKKSPFRVEENLLDCRSSLALSAVSSFVRV
jgi:hypothetical protein